MCIRTVIFTCLVLFSADLVEAQLFGPRSIGKNSRSRNLTAPDAVGTVTEDRRFVRGSRAADDFVGADKGEAAAFVGNSQAINDGTVTSSVTGLREQPTMRVNRPLTTRRTGIYAPRVTTDFVVPADVRPRPDVSASNIPNENDFGVAEMPLVSIALLQIIRRHQLQVSPSATGRAVVLTGTVPTEHDRRIAELLASFEPGLESVTTDLQVGPSAVRRMRSDQLGAPTVIP